MGAISYLPPPLGEGRVGAALEAGCSEIDGGPSLTTVDGDQEVFPIGARLPDGNAFVTARPGPSNQGRREVELGDEWQTNWTNLCPGLAGIDGGLNHVGISGARMRHHPGLPAYNDRDYERRLDKHTRGRPRQTAVMAHHVGQPDVTSIADRWG